MRNLLFLTIALALVVVNANAQGKTIVPDLQDTSQWGIFNREVTRDKEGIHFSNGADDGLMVLKGMDFGNGVIEADIKGENKQGQSFVGLAFNIQSPAIFDCIYFRPFNFKSPERNTHSVQYVHPPAYPWETLRAHFPGKYESKIGIPPDPDQWFHARIVVQDKRVKVYVNDEPSPSLSISRISLLDSGRVGFWVGNGSSGSFRNLKITPASPPAYGYDPSIGKYFEVAPKTRLYYEIYGEGAPILLLHGGVYGYINEFEYFIKELSKTNKVICLATRGHVKSDIGHEPFTYDQRASDAKKLLDHLGITKTIVLGFSDGGNTAYKLAASYPGVVEKLVVIGAGDHPKGKKVDYHYSADELMKNSGNYFKARVAAMPEPDRWEESLQMLNNLYENAFMSSETFSKINCPTLLIAGDQDQYSSPESMVKAHRGIAHSRLAIIAGCDHVVFYCNWPAVWSVVEPFLYQQ